MARWWRVYGKKRGHRWSGYPALAMVGELGFHGAIFILGCLGLALILVGFVIPDWRIHRDFLETPCTVLDVEVQKTDKSGGAVYRAAVKIRYEVLGETRVSTVYEPGGRYSEDPRPCEAFAQQFEEGKTYPCWYDPAHPDVVVLVRRYHWGGWLLMVVPAALIGVGGGGLLYGLIRWGISAERRALWVQQTKSLPRTEPGRAFSEPWPALPPMADTKENPGTTLAYRLPMFSERGWMLMTSFVVAVLWNGVVLIFAILTGTRFWQGEPDWLAAAFLVPFVVVGGAAGYWFFRQLVQATRIGPTLVEISAHPLQPGGRYELFVSQAGRLKMKFLEVLLVCEEEALYRQGTTARTETQRVYQDRLFRQEDFRISSEAVFQTRCRLVVPDTAMHSFQSPHNKVQWKVVVQAQADGWPPYQRSFPLVVLPAHANGVSPCTSTPTSPSV